MVTDIIASEGKLFLLPFLITVGKGNGGQGQSPQKIFLTKPFVCQENVLFQKRGQYKKGTFVPMLKRAGV